MSAASENRDLPRLAIMARALGLLVAHGASLGLLAWEIHAWPHIVPYAVNNTLAPNCRVHMVAAMASGVGLAVIVGTLLILLGKGHGLDLLHRVAYRSAPACLVALVPLLFDWELWVERDLTFLALVAVFGLALQGLMRIVLATPPVFAFEWPRLRRWMNGPLAVLGWQHLPLVITCLAGTFCTAWFGYYTVINHYNVRTSGYDLGIETNVVWNAAHGGPLLRSTPLGGQMNLLGLHHTFFAYVLAPVFRLFPRAETLLVLQAIFMGASVVPLFLIARRRVGPWIGCLVSCLLVLYPPFHGAVLYDFHYQPLSTFFLLMSLHLLEVRRNWWAALVILLTLSLREDMAALLTIIGLYLVLTGKRPRAGLVMAAASASCFVAQKMIWMPFLLGGHSIFVNQYEGLLPAGERGFAGVLKTVAGNPAFTVYGLLDQDKVTYLLKIFAPLALLPWRRPMGLLLFLPGFFFTLLETKYPALVSISFQYTAYWTPFVFIAAVDAVAWLRGAETGSCVPKTSLPAWLVAATAAMLVCSNQYGAIFQPNTARAGFDPFSFGRTLHDDAKHADLYALIRQIPQAASVIATEHVIPHVSARAAAFNMRYGPHEAEYLLIGFPLRDDEKRLLGDLLRSGKFGIVDVRNDFALAKRGYSAERNNALLSRVGG